MKKKIAVLGSTGSIGKQVIKVVDANPEEFEITALTANNNFSLLIRQAKKIRPRVVVIADETHYKDVKKALSKFKIKVLSGEAEISNIVSVSYINFVVVALVGYSALLPTIKAIEAKKQVALANKESLVVAGELITSLALKNSVKLLPIDSEHSAIFQCLNGENYKNIEKVILTASGGPFRTWSEQRIEKATIKQALRHPNWSMGSKITIDSATMMNKGLEMIEAKWLFDLNPDQIEIIIHPQSIIHSIVQFVDGSMKSQMGLPDMKTPILYALSYPNRLLSNFKRFSFKDFNKLTFEEPNYKMFRSLVLASYALSKGGNAPCILNAANEIAVQYFLENKISFLEIPIIVEKTLSIISFKNDLSLQDYIDYDLEARSVAKNIMA